MTDSLTRLLDERTADEPVGPPPLDAMHRVVVRRRRGRLAVLGAAASVVLVAGVVSVTGDGPASRQVTPPPVATSSPDPGSDAPPPGFRWVGEGRAVVAVPVGWATNDVRCGTPQSDTAVVDQGFICLALVPYPEGTSSVEVRRRYPIDERDDYAEQEVEGEPALLSPLRCSDGDGFSAGTCRQSLVLPALDVVFAAESSRGRAAVTEILDRVAILDESVAVPGHQSLAVNDQGRSGAAYVAALTEAGLRAEVRTEVRRGVDPGYVLDASPAPGTVVEPGSTVVVTVVAEPEGPADEIVIGMAGERGSETLELTDEELRAGPTVRLGVGDALWTYAYGRRQRTYAALLAGDALVGDGWADGPNYPNSWDAVRPGTSTIELSIEVDGERLLLATVTVVVTGS